MHISHYITKIAFFEQKVISLIRIATERSHNQQAVNKRLFSNASKGIESFPSSFKILQVIELIFARAELFVLFFVYLLNLLCLLNKCINFLIIFWAMTMTFLDSKEFLDLQQILIWWNHLNQPPTHVLYAQFNKHD